MSTHASRRSTSMWSTDAFWIGDHVGLRICQIFTELSTEPSVLNMLESFGGVFLTILVTRALLLVASASLLITSAALLVANSY